MPAIKTTYTKHVGSVALGSLLHVVMAPPRFIARHTSNLTNVENPNGAQKCLFTCCSCVDTMVEYVHYSAYAMVAITGDAYCPSAKQGFYLSLKHLD